MANKILITDLRDPVLTGPQRELMEEAERNPAELSAESVLTTAAARARLDDFGSDDFLERMRVIIDEVNSNENATELLRHTIFNRLVANLVNRLLRVDLLRRHPEVHDVRIERPIMVAGLPRSGTTHLLGLVSADSRLRSLVYWESLQPIPFQWETATDGVDPRYVRAQRGWERLQLVNPLIAPYHPMDPDHIHEDLELQCPDIASYYWEWHFKMPHWRDYYLAHDQTPHYEYGKTGLKIMTWQDGVEKRWVLKCPQHFEQLGPLTTTYPDAFVVFTHRDPVASLQSIVTQLAYVIRTREKHIDPDWYLEYWVDRVRRLLAAYVRDVELVPEEQRLDVYFDELVEDGMGTVARIYEAAGLPMTDQARAELAGYQAAHERGKYGAIDHNLRRDFGVDPDEIREQFSFYFDRLRLTAEAR